MPQFCILFCANYTILAIQKGGPWPNGPPKYAPGLVHREASDLHSHSRKHKIVSCVYVNQLL